MDKSQSNQTVVCAACGLDITKHVEITWIGCLASLSGEIEVYRETLRRDGSGGKQN